MLKIILNIVRQAKGTISKVPASVYEILNLLTSKSFILSLKLPKQNYEKNMATIKNQNVELKDFNYFRLNASSSYFA
jgi:Fe2+ or Zn2+ uptake regulation protein